MNILILVLKPAQDAKKTFIVNALLRKMKLVIKFYRIVIIIQIKKILRKISIIKSNIIKIYVDLVMNLLGIYQLQ